MPPCAAQRRSWSGATTSPGVGPRVVLSRLVHVRHQISGTRAAPSRLQSIRERQTLLRIAPPWSARLLFTWARVSAGRPRWKVKLSTGFFLLPPGGRGALAGNRP